MTPPRPAQSRPAAREDDDALAPDAHGPDAVDVCARCGRGLAQRARYRLPDGQLRCIRCVWRHPRIVRRALITAAIVGTVLTLINQGDRFLTGDITTSVLLKMALTYCVPYIVSTSGAVGLSRVRDAHGQGT